MSDRLNIALLAGCTLLLLAVIAVRLAARAGLPSLLLYLAIGVAVGESGLGLRFDDYGLTADLGLIALALILAEGGLTTQWDVVRPVMPMAVVLATVGVGVSVAVIAGAAHLLLHVDLRTALLLGAVVSSTDAAAVFSVLRQLPLRARIRSVLEAESGINDAPAVVLVTLASSSAWEHTGVAAVLGEVLLELAGGAVIGLAVGMAGRELLSRIALPSAGLYPVATLTLSLVAFTGANAVHTSGFLAVYLAGLVLGNAGLPHRRAVLGFANSVALLAEVGLFVLLGLLVSPSRLPSALGPALLIGAVASLLARPAAVFVAGTPFGLPWREQAFLSWAGLRGAVPIVLATVPVTAGLAGSERVVDTVFVLVVVYTLLQAPTLPALARRLRVTETGETREIEVEAAPLEELRATLLQVTIPALSRLVGVYVDELRLPDGAQVTLVVRKGRSFAPDRHTRLTLGDQVLVVTTINARRATERRLRAVSRAGKLAEWYGEHGAPSPGSGDPPVSP